MQEDIVPPSAGRDPKSHTVFLTGKYHKRFAKNHIHFLRNAQLLASYHTSSSLVHTLGWPHPLLKQEPRILLCGTASPYTTLVFARFVGKHNTMARIDTLDISCYPLVQSKRVLAACQDIDPVSVSFVEANALRMPFPDDHFDWIETDFFIQFGKHTARLKPESIDAIPVKMDAHTQFFLRSNPGYLQGDELVCVARVAPGNATSIFQRLVPFHTIP